MVNAKGSDVPNHPGVAGMAKIRIKGAHENNLKGIDIDFGDGLTVVTGVSGSGKSSLVFDTLYHEARRRLLEVFNFGGELQLSPAQVDSLTGVGPAVAVEQNLLNNNPASTLATFSGLHPFLRLLYARFGERSCQRCGASFLMLTDDEIVSEICRLAGSERCDSSESMSAKPDDSRCGEPNDSKCSKPDESESIRIYVPLLRGVTGSHRTLLTRLSAEYGCASLRVDHRIWNGTALDAARQHHLDLRIAEWKQPVAAGQVRAALRQAWAMGAETLRVETSLGGKTFARAPVCADCGAWFSAPEPAHFHLPCPNCHGAGCSECGSTGMHPVAAATRWQGLNLPELLALSVEDALSLFSSAHLPPSAGRLLQEILRRLEALVRVGLGYIGLNRPSPTLSRGESQRVRLAVVLISRLEDMLHVLDEPTVGQHPADVNRLLEAFRDLPGPVVFVEHDRVAAAAADWAVDLGPDAGVQGGSLLFSGTPAALWQSDTHSGRYFSLRERVHIPSGRKDPDIFLLLQGVSARNLQNPDIPLALGRFNVITGVSGSGKSTLIREVLAPTLSTRKAVGCRAFGFLRNDADSRKARESGTDPESPENQGFRTTPQSIADMDAAAFLPEVVFVDQNPIGRNPRSNPATYTKLADVIRDFWSTQTGLSPSHFTFNRPEGACSACKGLGAVEVPMRYLPSVWIPCEECGTLRFSDEVLAATLPFGEQVLSIGDFFRLSIREATDLFLPDPRLTDPQRRVIRPILTALCDIGLGYLQLGQPSPTLSGGEAQRIKLAKYLGRKDLADSLLILDEPSTGLHPKDIAGLLTVLDRLVRAGATIVVVEHDTDTIRAADWVIDLGPGAGPHGGQLLYAGKPDGLPAMAASMTGKALCEEMHLQPREASVQPVAPLRMPVLSIRHATANNLKNLDVAIEKGKLTVVTGVSGSGKSSLVIDVLEAEARRRLLESLSLYERQGLREGPEAPAEEITGLGVVATVGSTRGLHARRATVGTVTELSHHLAILMSWLGERACLQCGNGMERHPVHWRCTRCGSTAPIAPPRYFQASHYQSACTVCNGVGTRRKPNPAKLIIRPDLPVCGGAMYSPGFFPKGYLGKPYNGGYDYVRALAAKYGFDPAGTPWNRMSPEAQQAFLFGDPVPMPVRFENKSGRIHDEILPFPGFYGWVRDWDTGGTYTDTEPCPACLGARLRPEYLAVTLSGSNLHALNNMPLRSLERVLTSLETTLPQVPPEIRKWAEPSLRTCLRRLQFLMRVGVGYIHLDRSASSVSAGEAQRLSLAGLLGSGLTSLVVLLDEPTRGLHPSEVRALVEALLELRGSVESDAANTILVVEHDPEVLRAADRLIDMGPGAGASGGRIVAQGTPWEVSQTNTVTARWLRGDLRPILRARHIPDKWMKLLGARGNNLKNLDLSIPLGLLVGLCGVSGSGKSTLLTDTLGLALAPKRQTTSVAQETIEPAAHDAIEHAPERVVLVDQARSGIRNTADYLDLEPAIHALYAESEDAQALGLDVEALGHGCSVCGGTGFHKLDMGFLPDIIESCETCQGTGYREEVRDLRLRGVSLPDFFLMTIDEVLSIFGDSERLVRPLKLAQEVGLGYLCLKQAGHSLSGGEAQRLKIAKELSRKTKKGESTLYLLDEPTLGLHLEDVAVLVRVLHRLVAAGGTEPRNTVLVVEHHPHVLAACDWLIELGPVGGPEGGYLIAEGPPERVSTEGTPTAPFLREVLASANRLPEQTSEDLRSDLILADCQLELDSSDCRSEFVPRTSRPETEGKV